MTQKKKTWDKMSRYIRLRDAMEYCRTMGVSLHQFNRPEDVIGQCCTCGVVKSWIRMDAGHCISRGSGGMSGVYFDERNVALQCKRCNGFEQGRRSEFEKYLTTKYGDGIMDELTILDKTNSYKYKLEGLEMYYTQKYNELVAEFKENKNERFN